MQHFAFDRCVNYCYNTTHYTVQNDEDSEVSEI